MVFRSVFSRILRFFVLFPIYYKFQSIAQGRYLGRSISTGISTGPCTRNGSKTRFFVLFGTVCFYIFCMMKRIRLFLLRCQGSYLGTPISTGISTHLCTGDGQNSKFLILISEFLSAPLLSIVSFPLFRVVCFVSFPFLRAKYNYIS